MSCVVRGLALNARATPLMIIPRRPGAESHAETSLKASRSGSSESTPLGPCLPQPHPRVSNLTFAPVVVPERWTSGGIHQHE